MVSFTQIEYDGTIKNFDNEEKAGRRYKLGELKTSLWLKKNNIKFEDVIEISNQMPDPRLMIIGEGKLNGFYIYSTKLKKCFKNFEGSLVSTNISK